MKAVEGIHRQHGMPEAGTHKEPANFTISNELMIL